MTNKRSRKKRSGAATKHPVDELFAKKIERSAQDAYQKRRGKEMARLGPRQRVVRTSFDAFKRELRGRHTNGFSMTDDRLALEIERALKPVCKRCGLEQEEPNKDNKKEPGED